MSIKFLILLIVIFVIINSDVFLAVISDFNVNTIIMQGTCLLGGFAIGSIMIEKNYL